MTIGLSGPERDETHALEVIGADHVVGGHTQILEIGRGAEHAFDGRIVPVFVIADGREIPAVQTRLAHRAVRGWQAQQRHVVHALPVGASSRILP